MYHVVEVYQIHSDDGETYMTYADRDTAHTICDGINKVLELRRENHRQDADDEPDEHDREHVAH